MSKRGGSSTAPCLLENNANTYVVMLLLAYIFLELQANSILFTCRLPSTPQMPLLGTPCTQGHEWMCLGSAFSPAGDRPGRQQTLSSFALPYFDGSIRADHKTSVGRREPGHGIIHWNRVDSCAPLFLEGARTVQTDAGSQRARNARQKGLAEAWIAFFSTK